MSRTRLVSLASCACLLAFAALPALVESTEASFTAIGPGGLKIIGKTTEVRAVTEGDSLVVTVKLKGLDTGLELRNKHLNEKTLHTDKYPEAVFKVAWSALKKPEAGDVEAEAAGTLSLHGQTKPAKVKYKASKSGPNFAVDGSIRIDIRDFGMEIPSYMGATVKPEVDAQVRFAIAAR